MGITGGHEHETVHVWWERIGENTYEMLAMLDCHYHREDGTIRPVGRGETEWDAIADLCKQLNAWEE